MVSCCTGFYEHAEVREWMGESFHPGGPALTERTIAQLRLQPQMRVLDVACGAGTTTRQLARAHGATAVGLDLGPANLEAARQAVRAEKLDATFVQGDAHALPFDDNSFDAVVCECALSTFSDKPLALSELARVTRPGGALGLSDMAIYGELPPTLAALAGPWACLGEATSVETVQRLLLDAGYRVAACADESESLLALALELKRKLVVLGLGNLSGLLGVQVDLPQLRQAIAEAQAITRAGSVQYFRLAATLGVPLPATEAPAKSSPSQCC